MYSLSEIREKNELTLYNNDDQIKIVVGLGTCGIAAGGDKIWASVQGFIRDQQADVVMMPTGCIGLCYAEPIMEVHLPGQARLIYGGLNPDTAVSVIKKHLQEGIPSPEFIIAQDTTNGVGMPGLAELSTIPFCQKQVKHVLGRCGVIDPDEITHYIALNGYEALEKVLQTINPLDIIDEISKSGLRGRGGGGFITSRKWELASQAVSTKKYVVCNADEGDPGAFMDRSILEGDPHSLLEGMAICGYAIGADEGYIYVRAEYPLAIKRLQKAIHDAESMGLLGDNILGSGFSFHVHISAGAGAFVCGEETSLLQSIEGKRGMPRVRPPYPVESGLWGKPTVINNVETYANVPGIIRQGADWFASMGTPSSKGTKVFALTGKINRTGLAEVPIGITLREIIFDIGGGIQDNKQFKAVQIGGPSGGCIPEQLLDTQVDYDSLLSLGAMIGSGGLVVMDDTNCMVDVARYFLNFTQEESCGKCTPCREGTKRMLQILERICDGKGRPEDISELQSLSEVIKSTSLCGLGQSAPNPVLATLRYFKDEYEEHIYNHNCPAGVCTELLGLQIDSAKCTGCTMCKKVCPVHAITGDRKKQHIIDQLKCIKCKACLDQCRFEAIVRA